jgi:hypothetical protein
MSWEAKIRVIGRLGSLKILAYARQNILGLGPSDAFDLAVSTKAGPAEHKLTLPLTSRRSMSLAINFARRPLPPLARSRLTSFPSTVHLPMMRRRSTAGFVHHRRIPAASVAFTLTTDSLLPPPPLHPLL